MEVPCVELELYQLLDELVDDALHWRRSESHQTSSLLKGDPKGAVVTSLGSIGHCARVLKFGEIQKDGGLADVGGDGGVGQQDFDSRGQLLGVMVAADAQWGSFVPLLESKTSQQINKRYSMSRSRSLTYRLPRTVKKRCAGTLGMSALTSRSMSSSSWERITKKNQQTSINRYAPFKNQKSQTVTKQSPQDRPRHPSSLPPCPSRQCHQREQDSGGHARG